MNTTRNKSVGVVTSGIAYTRLEDFTSVKQENLTQSVRNGLNMAIDIGRHRTIGGEDTAMRMALRGLADGILAEIFEIFRMVDVDIPETKDV